MKKDPLSLSSYLFDLPESLIAQRPVGQRDHSRLMVIDRKNGSFTDMLFCDLPDFLSAGDSLVLNDTRVIPARLLGKREGGGASEILLLKQLSLDTWEVMARPGKRLRPGSQVFFGENLSCTVLETLLNGNKTVKFAWKDSFEAALEQYGHMPIPPYIRRGSDDIKDKTSYQTVYAKTPGAVAAPTAGLHFTDDLLNKLREKGVDQTWITLHVGLGTFRPVQSEDIRNHTMHNESFILSPESAEKLNSVTPLHRQICVGTTCCRTLESAMKTQGKFIPGKYETDIFIYPGYQFKYVRSMITNFHLPGSSLLMLVSAFAGYDLIMEAYARAIEKKYRFYSYGDAMLIL